MNIRRAEALIRDGRMTPAGRTAFQRRDPTATGSYSFENRPGTLAPDDLERCKANERAWAFFQAQAPWCRRTAIFWIMEAKREDTRQRRLGQLIDDLAHARTIPPLTRSPRGKK